MATDVASATATGITLVIDGRLYVSGMPVAAAVDLPHRG
jgi:hypothetical protein